MLAKRMMKCRQEAIGSIGIIALLQEGETKQGDIEVADQLVRIIWRVEPAIQNLPACPGQPKLAFAAGCRPALDQTGAFERPQRRVDAARAAGIIAHRRLIEHASQRITTARLKTEQAEQGIAQARDGL